MKSLSSSQILALFDKMQSLGLGYKMYMPNMGPGVFAKEFPARFRKKDSDILYGALTLHEYKDHFHDKSQFTETVTLATAAEMPGQAVVATTVPSQEVRLKAPKTTSAGNATAVMEAGPSHAGTCGSGMQVPNKPSTSLGELVSHNMLNFQAPSLSEALRYGQLAGSHGSQGPAPGTAGSNAVPPGVHSEPTPVPVALFKSGQTTMTGSSRLASAADMDSQQEQQPGQKDIAKEDT